jgi:luciferase-like monooxygenase
MNVLNQFVEEVSTWPNISVRPHRFGGREFLFGTAEVGHVHVGGVVDIPFTRPLRDALLQERLAEEHHWVPNSGWITFRLRTDEGLAHALWLLRLSYLRYALKTARDPHGLLEQECESLHLTSGFRSLLEKHLPSSHPVSAERRSA